MQSNILSALQDSTRNHMSAVSKTIEFESIAWQSLNMRLKYHSIKFSSLEIVLFIGFFACGVIYYCADDTYYLQNN